MSYFTAKEKDGGDILIRVEDNKRCKYVAGKGWVSSAALNKLFNKDTGQPEGCRLINHKKVEDMQQAMEATFRASKGAKIDKDDIASIKSDINSDKAGLIIVLKEQVYKLGYILHISKADDKNTTIKVKIMSHVGLQSAPDNIVEKFIRYAAKASIEVPTREIKKCYASSHRNASALQKMLAIKAGEELKKLGEAFSN